MANITKRGNSYRIKVSCGYDSRGHQIVKSKTFKPDPGLTPRQTEKALNLFAMEFEQKVLSGYYCDSSLRLEVYCETYLEIKKGKLSPITYQQYKRVINKHIIPQLGHLKLTEIKPFHIQNFIAYLENHGEISASTVKRYFTTLKSIFALAFKQGIIEINPTDTRRVELPQQEEPETEIFTKEETAHMLDCLEDEPLQFRLLIHLALVTGCRRGELVALQWDSVDFKSGKIAIKQSAYKVAGEEISLKSPKTKKSVRTVAVPSYIIDMLKRHKTEQSKEMLKLGSLWQRDNFVFTQWNGKMMYPTTPTLLFSRFLDKNNLPHRKFHALRHTSATLLLASGTDIKTVGNRLGHTQLSTTNRYVHALASADEQAADTFESMFVKQA